jgi:hypothetical protein
MLLEFLDHISTQPHRVKFASIRKDRAIVDKMIDWLIEPVAHVYGINIYEKNEHKVMSDALYYGLRAFGEPDFLNQLLMLFQSMIRNKTMEDYENFCEFLFKKQPSNELEELLDYLRIGPIELGKRILENPEHLDVWTSTALCLVGLWCDDIQEGITLIHDESARMVKDKELWRIVTDPSQAPMFLPNGVRQKIQLEQTISGNSSQWTGLQLADLLAGALVQTQRWFQTEDIRDDFGKRLADVMAKSNFYIFMIPSPETFDL